MNKIFNLFIAIFSNKYMFLYIFSYSTSNVSQVAFLTYRNEMLNFFLAIFSNKYMLYYLFSYSTPKVQSIETQQLLFIPQFRAIRKQIEEHIFVRKSSNK